MRILIIDDDAQVRSVLLRLLERAGHEVHVLASGRGLKEVLDAHELDAVVTDVFMPEMDGLQALAVLKTLRPNLPVVVMSGGSSMLGNCLSMAKMMGAAAILEKPVTLTALQETLRVIAAPGTPAAKPAINPAA